MKGKRALWLVVILALLCASGIVGMLVLTETAWTWPFLAMAALPLAVGAWRWRAERALLQARRHAAR